VAALASVHATDVDEVPRALLFHHLYGSVGHVEQAEHERVVYIDTISVSS
jgi:hypothetical protein